MSCRCTCGLIAVLLLVPTVQPVLAAAPLKTADAIAVPAMLNYQGRLTDGAGNVSMGSLPPQEEALAFAEQIAGRNFRTVVINMEHASFDQGLAQTLADHLEAPCYTLNELKAESLLNTVRQEIAEPKKK